MAVTWEELRARTLARQFPAPTSGPASLPTLASAIGPIQSQTARSTFLGLAARAPGTTHAEVSAAFEALQLVRGSTLRGTVHTATPEQHRVLDAVTRVAQRRLWERTLRLERSTLEEVWDALEAYAAEEWRTPAELGEHLRSWLAARGETAARLDDQAGRYFAFGHGGLLRRPLRGGWEGQGAPGYRAAGALLDRRLPAPPDAVREVVQLHLAAHGPASRHDLAWWSGLGLRLVDEALAAIPGLVWETGPDAREYADLPDAPAPVDLPGVRLLPEFDAVLCAYDPKARDRFVTSERHAQLWVGGNGLARPPLLVDGTTGGWWCCQGPSRRRPLEVWCFPGARRPTRAELAGPVAALEAALDIEVTAVDVN